MWNCIKQESNTGVKEYDGKVVVPPLYHSIAQPIGAYCAFEEIPQTLGCYDIRKEK